MASRSSSSFSAKSNPNRLSFSAVETDLTGSVVNVADDDVGEEDLAKVAPEREREPVSEIALPRGDRCQQGPFASVRSRWEGGI